MFINKNLLKLSKFNSYLVIHYSKASFTQKIAIYILGFTPASPVILCIQQSVVKAVLIA